MSFQADNNSFDKLRLLNIKGDRLVRLQKILTEEPRMAKLFLNDKINSIEFIDGTSFAQYYDFVQILGAGSFGLVFSAKDRRTSEQCAVKVLSKSRMNAEDLKAMQAECEFLRKISNANVIRLYGVSNFF